MLHLYQCSSDHSSTNIKIWLRGVAEKVILNTHMELDMFSIRQIQSYCREINHTENHSDSHHQKNRAEALLKIKANNSAAQGLKTTDHSSSWDSIVATKLFIQWSFCTAKRSLWKLLILRIDENQNRPLKLSCDECTNLIKKLCFSHASSAPHSI